MSEETKEERKQLMKLPKEEQPFWALLTAAWICFSTGLLTVLEGMKQTEWTSQLGYLVASVIVFGFGGYLMHVYNRWFIIQLKK